MLSCLELIEYGFTSFIKPLANLIEVHAARGSLDQRRAEAEFKVFQAPADGGHGDTQPFRSLSEAARFNDHDERTDFLNLAHNVAPYIIILKFRIIFCVWSVFLQHSAIITYQTGHGGPPPSHGSSFRQLTARKK